MKLINIVLSGIIYLLVLIPLISIAWTLPLTSSNTYFIQIAAVINYGVAGIFAATKAEQFYKWFKSHIE